MSVQDLHGDLIGSLSPLSVKGEAFKRFRYRYVDNDCYPLESILTSMK